MSASADNPCIRCGACCAAFRVDFAREELESEWGHVPDGLTVEVTGSLPAGDYRTDRSRSATRTDSSVASPVRSTVSTLPKSASGESSRLASNISSIS